VTVNGRAYKLGITVHAKAAGVTVRSRGGRPGLDWRTVEEWIARSRIESAGPTFTDSGNRKSPVGR